MCFWALLYMLQCTTKSLTSCDILISGVDLLQGFDSWDSDFRVGTGPIWGPKFGVLFWVKFFAFEADAFLGFAFDDPI
jgi:hypothetical protein